jgi:DNA-binding transcriptional MerR regulator
MATVRRIDEASPNRLTIEQLAAETGMSVRNIRAHQARGLLSAPEVRLRVGYYGPEHVAQLRLIQELQAEGFNLGGIKRLLDDTQGTAEKLLRFREALTPAGDRKHPRALSATELGEEVVRSGISLRSAVAILEEVERECDSIAREFLKLFVDEVWKPFERAGMPAERLPEVEQAIERLRPIASQALAAIFEQRMGAQVERAVKDMTRRLSERGRS